MSNDFPFNHFINIDKFNKNQTVTDSSVKEYDIIKNALGMEQKSEKIKENQIVSEDSFNSSELASLSEALLDGIKDVVSPQKYKAFFENSFAVKELKENEIVFTVTNSFIEKVIKNNYLGQIKDILFNFLGNQYEIKFEILGSAVSNISSLKETTSEYTPQTAKTVSSTSFKLDEENLSTNKEIQEEVDIS